MTKRHQAAIVAAIVIGTASSALAADVETLQPGQPDQQKVARQCLKDLQAFDQKLNDVGFGVLPPGGYGLTAPTGYYGFPGTPREQIEALRGAAQVLAYEGDEQACEQVLSKMRQTFEEHQKMLSVEADNPEAADAWRRAHLANAKPVTEMSRLMRADVVIGSDLRNRKDEELGEIKDVVIDPTDRSIAYVLVSRGGFLGFGSELVAVPWQDLRATPDHEIFVLDVPRSAFEKAPAVGSANFAETASREWRQKLDQFWNEQLKG
jgi:sporulation protein YlmC with PRC-barrel domain